MLGTAVTSGDELWPQANHALHIAIEARREEGEAVPSPVTEP
jgi:hypothetical protein